MERKHMAQVSRSAVGRKKIRIAVNSCGRSVHACTQNNMVSDNIRKPGTNLCLNLMRKGPCVIDHLNGRPSLRVHGERCDQKSCSDG